jgi:hypothetical protein
MLRIFPVRHRKPHRRRRRRRIIVIIMPAMDSADPPQTRPPALRLRPRNAVPQQMERPLHADLRAQQRGKIFHSHNHILH